MLSVGNGDENSRYYAFQICAPIDDTNTMHFWYSAYMPPKDTEVDPKLTEKVHLYEVPFKNKDGEFILTTSKARTLWLGHPRTYR